MCQFEPSAWPSSVHCVHHGPRRVACEGDADERRDAMEETRLPFVLAVSKYAKSGMSCKFAAAGSEAFLYAGLSRILRHTEGKNTRWSPQSKCLLVDGN